MESHAEQILETALNLPASDRAQIAATLLQSLDQASDPATEAAWAAEIERRLREMDDGRVTLIPWEQVLHTMRERIHG
jgi:putative addiction module component (TIGR02574 family)